MTWSGTWPSASSFINWFNCWVDTYPVSPKLYTSYCGPSCSWTKDAIVMLSGEPVPHNVDAPSIKIFRAFFSGFLMVRLMPLGSTVMYLVLNETLLQWI